MRLCVHDLISWFYPLIFGLNTSQFMKIPSTLNQLKTWPLRTSGRPPIALGESPRINQPILGEEFLAFDRCISEVVANALPKVVLALLIASAVFVSSNPRVKATKVEMGTWAFMAAVVGREVFAEVCGGVNPVTSKLTLGDQTLNTYYFTKSPVAELSTFTGPLFPYDCSWSHILFWHLQCSEVLGGGLISTMIMWTAFCPGVSLRR